MARYAARVDDNQQSIIDDLRAMHISVEPRHDDLLVGYRKHTYWFEVKNPARCFKADGFTMRKGMIKPSQEKIRRTWLGHYSIVTTTEEILKQIEYDGRMPAYLK